MAQIRINGRYWAWASCEWSVTADGGAEEIFVPIAAVDYGDAVDMTLVYGAGRLPLGVADGIYTPEEMTMTVRAQYLREWMARVTGDGESLLSDLQFRLTVKRKVRADASAPLITDTIDFRIKGLSDSGESASADALDTEMTCQILLIERNGVKL
jgi:hypothetical protein